MKLRTSFKRDAVPNDLTHLARALTAIGAHGTADDFGQAAGDTYEPFRLMDRKIILSDETLGAISQFEMLASRCDTLIGTSPLGTALARIMARMDGMFVAQLNGRRADYRLCCCLDFFKESGTAKGGSDEARLSALGLDLTPASVLSASKCAHQMETIELNSLCGAAPALITPGHVLALQQAIGRTFHPKVSSGLRTWDLPGEGDEPDADAYRPPSPLELPEFLQDLVTFLNESPLGPSAKVALMHYQLEATKMFSSDTDQLARALLVGIWRNTGLIKYLMPPIAITPALARRNHDEVLRPYQFAPGLSEMQMIDNWVYHTACASQNAFEVAPYGYTIAHQTLDRWRSIVAARGTRLTDTMERLLVTVVGSPVFSASSAAEAIGTTFTTATKIIGVLEACDIVRQMSRGRRNKVYECPEAVALFEKIVPDLAG